MDTNVISELSRKVPDPKVSQWLVDHEDGLFLSVLTLGELEKGLMKVTDAKRRARLRSWVQQEVPEWFAGRILPIDQPVAIRWGQLVGSSRDPIPTIDALLAATALTHGLTVVTRNITDLSRTGVKILNPWD
ncbi:MAG TPA: type II toxin-antitoxin system VapC family toxin [Candidatus Limnocylindria bacterium]|nr:type II toxin-antitoxin system VapC family toxin [Candidatus Limnocylindria bacterium]